jgi:5'-nucleotidase
MGVTLDGQLVVAISSRALFDFEEENRFFEQSDDRAYMKLQLERLEQPAKPGVAFSLVKKLLAFNQGDAPQVEVVILSRNDPVSGMRVFRSAQHYGLPIQRGSFTRGQPPWRYLKPLNANLFLSAHLSDVRAALDAGVPAAQVYPHSAHASVAHPNEVRIAFDGDAVPKACRPFKPTNATKPACPCRPAPSNPCWPRCTACNALAHRACACAPPWSPPAAPPPTSAPSAR